MTKDAKASRAVAEGHVPGNQAACKVQLERLLKRLADYGTLRSPDQLRNEGDGLYAVKARCGLRAYGWFESNKSGRGCFVVSHFCMKKQKKLKQSDKDRALENRRQWNAGSNGNE